MSSLAPRLAHAIIRRYPSAWRAEYGEDLHAFVDDSSTGWRDVLDLARGCVVERARSLVAPEEHPQVAAAVWGLVRLLPPLAMSLGALGAGTALRSRYGPRPSSRVTERCCSWARSLASGYGRRADTIGPRGPNRTSGGGRDRAT
jgi:hypothetical protein